MLPADIARCPRRIQRSRTAGWRMPPGAVYVGRPSKWGNPYRVGWPAARWCCGPGIPRLTPSRGHFFGRAAG